MLSGSFGTLILQLPVEGGHVGGRLKVKYQGKEQVYERGVRNSKESRTLARESILESQIRIKNH